MLTSPQVLTDCDRLGIVLFDDRGYVLTELKRLTPERKTYMVAKITTIEVRGGTQIGAGLKLGLDMLDFRIERNKCAGILLLSDGQDGFGSRPDTEKSVLLRRADTIGSPIFTFGIGDDHDSDTLEGFSCNGGTFSSIRTIQDIRLAFMGALGGLKGSSIRNCTVTVDILHGDLVAVFAGYPVVERTRTSFKVSLSDVYFNEERNIVCDVLGDRATAKAEIRYTIVSNHESVNAFTDIVHFGERDDVIGKHRIRITITDAEKAALALAELNDAAGAVDILVTARNGLGIVPQGDPYISALLQELDQKITKFQRRQFSAGDVSEMRSMAQANSRQRAVLASRQSATVSMMIPTASHSYM